VETFTYDALNRLKTSLNTNYDYDVLGNIKTKTDISDTNGYKYEGKPHQVTKVVKGATTTNYSYDAAGNMANRGSTVLAYNSYNKPTRITDGNLKTTFNYGPDLARFYREDLKNNQTTRKTYYMAGGDYEEVYDAATKETKFKHNFGNGVQLTLTKEDGQPTGSVDVQFMHKDHLGSVDVITDMSGKVVKSMAFQPFGDRKKQLVTDLDPNTDLAMVTFETTTDGFTGHEMLDDFGLIHMNGRVYDPAIGRFLSADPFVQAPENSQSFNRYSYVMNNPLSLVDPSGYIWWFVAPVLEFFTFETAAIAAVGVGTGVAVSNVDFVGSTPSYSDKIYSNPITDDFASEISYVNPAMDIVLPDLLQNIPEGPGDISRYENIPDKIDFGSKYENIPDFIVNEPYLNVTTGEGRDYVTYVGTKGGLPYTGIASAPSEMGLSSGDIISRRYGGDYSDFGGLAPTPVYEGSGVQGKRTARGLEQYFYELDVAKYGKDNVANRQRPVGSNNVSRQDYYDAANDWLKNR